VRKFNLAKYAKLKFLSDCAVKSALLGLPINHIIILTPFLTEEKAALVV
jgi:hypothetical protein